LSGVRTEGTTVLNKQTRDKQEEYSKIAQSGETLGLALFTCRHLGSSGITECV